MKDLKRQIINIFKKTDRTDWKPVKFGDIAFNISERIDPNNTDAKIYVGLEHLDSDSIHIHRLGIPSDVKGVKLRVYKGDIIFGKRRAYQRKASVAEFDGICSAHAMVLRANPENIDPNFFPFFLHSDTFMNRAIEISEGSLSPTIKWKVLEHQEFLLPPRSVQKKLSEILWKIDELEQKFRISYGEFLALRLSYLVKSFSSASKNAVPLGKLPINTINGLWKSEDHDSIEVKVIRSTEFLNFGEINLSELKPLLVSSKKFEKSKLISGDIIIERSGGGPKQPVGRVCYFDLDDDNYSFSNFTSIIRVEDKDVLYPKYLFYFLEVFYERGLTDRIQKQTTGIRNLDYDLYLSTKVPLPDIKRQIEIVSQIDEIELNRRSLSKQIEQTRTLRNVAVNNIFI
ncbi:MAG: restriction endonuclease subunit S [bacterium]